MKVILKKLLLVLKMPFLLMRSCDVALSSQIGRRVSLKNSLIGQFVHIGTDCIINNAEIGPYSSIAPHVQVGGLEHPYWEYSTSVFLSEKSIRNRTIIGHDVWIGASSIIKSGVKLGDGCVVGANSFVNKDVPPYAIVVGSPARILKYRFSDTIIKELEDSMYWELGPKEAKKELDRIEHNILAKDE